MSESRQSVPTHGRSSTWERDDVLRRAALRALGPLELARQEESLAAIGDAAGDELERFGDVVYVSPSEPHPFSCPGDASEPFGFLCRVNAERDVPESVDGFGVCYVYG